MKEALNTLPTELSTAYQEVIARITRSDTENGDVGMQTMTWIFYAARPLQMDELLVALDVQDGYLDIDEEPQFKLADIIEMCQSLVVHEESSGVVRFVHPTVQSFLKSLNLSDVNIAKSCLTYLEYEAFDEICSNPKSLDIRLEKYKFCRYAAQFWGFHVRREVENEPDVQRAVLSLLASENKKDSMLQIEQYANSSLGSIHFTKGQTLLHVIAKNELATICRFILDERNCRGFQGLGSTQRLSLGRFVEFPANLFNICSFLALGSICSRANARHKDHLTSILDNAFRGNIFCPHWSTLIPATQCGRVTSSESVRNRYRRGRGG